MRSFSSSLPAGAGRKASSCLSGPLYSGLFKRTLIARSALIVLLCAGGLSPLSVNAALWQSDIRQHEGRLIGGKVIDALSGAQLPHATIFVSDRKTGVNDRKTGVGNRKTGIVCDQTGGFSFHTQPDSNPLALIVTHAGYYADTLRIQAGTGDSLFYLIALQPIIRSLDEVVVTTGVTRATSIRENPVSILSVSEKKIETSMQSNIIDALVKNAPGLNAVKTGPNISKPFIRGLGYNRVLTLYDGIRQEGQQWGDEHGIEVDAYNIQRAEVIKGPASLLYGSDAVAGVISLFPYVPGQKDGKIHGRMLSEYQGNNRLIGNGFRLGARHSHWVWGLLGSCRLATNYHNSVDGKVYLTGFRERNASGMLGYESRGGRTYLNATLYDNLQGIPDGSRDSLTRKFTQQIYETGKDDIRNRPVVPASGLASYTLSPLHQHIQHYRLYANSHYRAGNGTIDVTLGLQQNIRREYNHPTDPLQPGLFVRLNTLNYGIRYNLPVLAGMDFSVGVNGMYQANRNKDATDFPIPDYTLLDAGGFLYGRRKMGNWAISGGLRMDTRRIKGGDFYTAANPATGFDHRIQGPDTAGAYLQFPALRQNFSGLSLSLGATCRLSEIWSLKMNLARGYRSPNITEIASNGLDPGAHIVYLGRRDFQPEFSLEEDLGIQAGYRDVDFSFSAFSNHISHYIYLTRLLDTPGNPVTLVPGNKTYQYTQSAAWLYGGEVSLDIHPAAFRGFRFSNACTFTYGDNMKPEYKGKGVNGRYLPLIPPLAVTSSLDWNSSSMPVKRMAGMLLKGVNARAEVEHTSAQHRYLSLDGTETPTPSYTLFNLGIGIRLQAGRNSSTGPASPENNEDRMELQLQLQANNLFDVAYQSNLNRLKYFEYYSHSPNGRSGIYNMGRNICLKAILSF